MEKNKTEKNKYAGICKVGEKGQIVINGGYSYKLCNFL